MSALAHDLKIALRQLRRKPLFTLTAILTLAIGIGVNAVAFTVVNGLLFKGWASLAPADLGRIETLPGGDESGYASVVEYRRFAEATAGSLDLAAEGRSSAAWQHDGTTETAWILYVSPTYLALLDPTPIAGRVEVSSNGPMPAAVIGERFWRRKLNAAPLSELTLRLNGQDVSVAGVLDESFTSPAGIYSPDVWLPLEGQPLFAPSRPLDRPEDRWLFVLGRLRPGVSVPEAQGRLDTAAAAMSRDWPDTHRGRSARFRLLSEPGSERRGLATGAALGMGIIGLVLLLACFNEANLLLARAVERERDMGIRTAMGAGRWRLMRLVLTEGFVIALLAGGAALVVAWWTQSLLGSFAIPIEQPQHLKLAPDGRVVGFVTLLVFVSGVLPGLWPALSAARVDVARALGSAGGTSSGGRPSAARRWLVGVQVAGSTAFLVVAALFAQSYGYLTRADFGFASDRLVVAEVEPTVQGYDAARAERYVRLLAASIGALPGVADVAIADRVPFFIGFERETAVSAGAPCTGDTCPKAATLAVDPGYFRTLGITLAEGREFDADSRSLGEVIVNQPLARLLAERAVGQPGVGAATTTSPERPSFRVGDTLRVGDSGAVATIVAVTTRSHTRGLDRERPTLYLPLGSEQFAGVVTIAVRTAGPPADVVLPVGTAARAIDPGIALLSVKTMEQRMAVQLWPFRTLSWLFSICGALALVLATVGLAAVVIHAVTCRQREFGVRVSVGATPGDLAADVLRGSAGLLLPGGLAGILLAGTVARLAQVVFIGVNVLHPGTYVAVLLCEAAVVAVACLAPALRASRVDPLIALRTG